MKYDGNYPIILDSDDLDSIDMIAKLLNDTGTYGEVDIVGMFRDDNDSPTVYLFPDSIKIFSTSEGEMRISRIFITEDSFDRILGVIEDGEYS